MPKDPRSRNIKGHATANNEPVILDWASDTQKAVFEYGPFPCLASGGFGSSKSFAFCLKALWLSDTFPNNRGVVARKEFEMLKNTTMSTFFKICPPESYQNGGRRSDSEKILRLNNGSEILWMHLDDPETENVIRGLEINWFFLDQAEEIEEEIFDMMLARLGRWDKATVPDWMIEKEGGIKKWAWLNPATGKPLVPTYPMLACNPDTELHWLWRRFHPDSSEWRDKYAKKNYKMFQMDSRENKFLPKQNLDAMLEQDESFVRRFVYGQWGIPEGQIHFVDPLSIIEGSDEIVRYLNNSCTLHRSMDHGDASPTCCLWWAVDRSGNVIFYREYYVPNRLVSDHRKAITELSQYEKYDFNLADPSIFFLTQQKHGGRWSTADEYSDCRNLPRETAIFWQPADNNELGTRNRINEYLRVDPKRIHPFTKNEGSPRLFFLQKSSSFPYGCDHVLRQTRSARREKVGSEQGRPIFSDERDDKLPDHAYDPLRYAMASRPPIAAEISQRMGKRTFNAVRAEYKRRLHKKRMIA
jgi:phage terminase large subunit